MSSNNNNSIEPSLGKFATIPRELRDIIWNNCLPKRPSLPKDISYLEEVQVNNLAILRVNRQICEEVASQIYSQEVLTFHITPTFSHGSWLSVSNKNGDKWHLMDITLQIIYSQLPYQRTQGDQSGNSSPGLGRPGSSDMPLEKG